MGTEAKDAPRQSPVIGPGALHRRWRVVTSSGASVSVYRALGCAEADVRRHHPSARSVEPIVEHKR